VGVRTGTTAPQPVTIAGQGISGDRAETEHRAVQLICIVLAAKRELAAGGFIAYRHAVLNAGAVCTELYREAAQRSLGTTSIGGFSDDAISRFLRDAVYIRSLFRRSACL
jgi:hypothetical protein